MKINIAVKSNNLYVAGDNISNLYGKVGSKAEVAAVLAEHHEKNPFLNGVKFIRQKREFGRIEKGEFICQVF